MKTLVLLLLLFPIISFAQTTTKQESPWTPMKFFAGEWKGTGEGEPGKGAYERSYQFVLGDKFIEVKNRSTYPPTDKDPKGEVHEDRGLSATTREERNSCCASST